ncbi:MAG: glycosyltransferase family 4 protein [Lentisphaeria bacterium]|nr:glycosyltransferase family 4 protein [Lentisphaeria bacterium]
MKIALAIYKYFAPSSGIQCDVLPLAEELYRRGHDVTLFSTSWDAPTPPSWLDLSMVEAFGLTNASRSAEFIRVVKERFTAGGFHKLVAFNRIPGADFYFAGDRPVAMQEAGFWQRISPRYRRNAALERELLSPESSTQILCVSPRQKLEFERKYGTQEERIHLLPPGIPVNRKLKPNAPEIREKMRAGLGIADDVVMLLNEGVNPASIGADRAIAAVAALPAELHSRVHLVVCCRGNQKPLKKLASRMGVEDIVTLMTPDFDLLELFVAADLLLHPSRNEMAGVSPLEAIASGLPVLAAPNHGWDHIVQESGGVILPVHFKRANIVSALKLLLLDEERIEEMKKLTSEYAKTADFYRRSKIAANLITGCQE